MWVINSHRSFVDTDLTLVDKHGGTIQVEYIINTKASTWNIKFDYIIWLYWVKMWFCPHIGPSFPGNKRVAGIGPWVYPKPEPVITVFIVIYQKYTEER
jgi:hypothetical protein